MNDRSEKSLKEKGSANERQNPPRDVASPSFALDNITLPSSHGQEQVFNEKSGNCHDDSDDSGSVESGVESKSTRGRKRQRISNDESDGHDSIRRRHETPHHLNANVPILSPELWAQILEYSHYDDVARVARVSRAFLHETMPLLKSLYFVSSGAFESKANLAVRFRNG